MNFEPQTYEELIRMKRCVELTKYYEVTEEELWEIYHFLEQEPEAFITTSPYHKSEDIMMAITDIPLRRTSVH